MGGPHPYESDGREVDAHEFARQACDPARSVVVEACAGSGKTWLLVARMLRLLLAGAKPSEILAITFTRKAAQEMRERLVRLLADLALLPDADAAALLLERGVARSELASVLPRARMLHETVLASVQDLSIDTFHGWFGKLIRIAPLSSGVPHGYALEEKTGELKAEAYRRLMRSLNHAEAEPVRNALLTLYEIAGDAQTRNLLERFLERRAEWWAAQRSGAPMDALRELCGTDGQRDARLSLWEDKDLLASIGEISATLAEGTTRNQARSAAIDAALNASPSTDSFANLLGQFRDENKGTPRGNDHRRGKLLQAIEKRGYGADDFEAAFEQATQALVALHRRGTELQVIALNEALFAGGGAYLEHYQAVKAERRVLDFADMEWHAFCLLTDADHAAYMQQRLDARYRHVLVDEFQDTNPLQWQILQAWLEAYGGDAERPSLFIVGDPKQSIYRFRRADPRVFREAEAELVRQGAALLKTNCTRRNAGAVVVALNDAFARNPLYSEQTTHVSQAGMVWRLPLVRRKQKEPQNDKTAAAGFSLRDPLRTPQQEDEDARRLEEGRMAARAILAARCDPDSGKLTPWAEIMVLVRQRTHLLAYETALREAGIPFVSDRRGGLLQSLEVDDLIALLEFLSLPGDNRALAQVLKSPIGGASDEDLVFLARRTERTWWDRLRASLACAPASLQRIAPLLEGWLQAAPWLPVHDLLDRIFHQGDLVARYACASGPLVRAKVIGNLEAFVALALESEAGRFPSLHRFLVTLRRLRRDEDDDAPDEAAADESIDAVRIMTIHGAKGLEADIVVLMNANPSRQQRDDLGLLCDWPQDVPAPAHFSAFHALARGAARDALFEQEEALARQEDWNLLYVAATRARRHLILGGVAADGGGDDSGLVEDSWYGRFAALDPFEPPPVGVGEPAVAGEEFELSGFEPPILAMEAGSHSSDPE